MHRLGLECILVPHKVSLAQAAEVTLPLRPAGAQAACARAEPAPWEPAGPCPSIPLWCVLPAVGCLGRLLGFLLGENVFLLPSSHR